MVELVSGTSFHFVTGTIGDVESLLYLPCKYAEFNPTVSPLQDENIMRSMQLFENVI